MAIKVGRWLHYIVDGGGPRSLRTRVVTIRRAVALLALLALPSAARAATFAYLSSAGPGEPALYGRRIRLTGPTGVFPYPAGGGGISMGFYEPAFSSSIYMYFVPPPGERFAPGPYDGAADCGYSARPGVCVERSFAGAPTGGHLDVLEATYDAGGNLLRFAADFSQHGGAVGSELLGSIRFNVGDGACGGAEDGTPCDDGDACSPSSSCLRGQCVADSVVPCSGPPAGPCHDAAACDPAAGTCAAPTFWNDGISCQPEDRCSLYGSCSAGVCGKATALYCGDGDTCTYNDCESTSGCMPHDIPGVCGRDGLPAALVFVQRTPGTFGDGLPFLGTPSSGGLDVNPTDDGVNVQSGSTTGGYLSLTIAPPPGVTLAPGTYDDVAASVYERRPGQAALDLSSSSGAPCAGRTGRFVVREYDPHVLEGDRGRALAFSADFEVTCIDGSTLSGAVRSRAGDAGCIAAPDGTPCDDLNACTAHSTCQAGACRGADPVVCGGPATCHAPSVCDPATGTCVPGPSLSDGTSCQDPATCTVSGACRDGACASTSETPPCDDGNPCTLDRCDGGGACTHAALPGCWLVAAKARITAQASGTLQGHSVQCGPSHCQRVGGSVLILPGDGTYRSPGGVVTCRDGTTPRLPDEVGSVHATRGGKLRFHVDNQREIRAAIAQCLGHRVSIASHEWVQIDASGRALKGVGRSRLTVFDQLPIVQTTVVHLDGRLGEVPPPPVLGPGAPVCQEQVRLQCRER
jgi:hypothetical protein